MSMVEFIGWVATFGTLLSFFFKDMFTLRIVNGSASLVWILYGVLQNDNPIIVINTSVIIVHLYWFYKNKILWKETK